MLVAKGQLPGLLLLKFWLCLTSARHQMEQFWKQRPELFPFHSGSMLQHRALGISESSVIWGTCRSFKGSMASQCFLGEGAGKLGLSGLWSGSEMPGADGLWAVSGTAGDLTKSATPCFTHRPVLYVEGGGRLKAPLPLGERKVFIFCCFSSVPERHRVNDCTLSPLASCVLQSNTPADSPE